MQLQIGDRLTDSTGEWEVVGRPYTTAGGKTANVRVKRFDSGSEMLRVWGAHEFPEGTRDWLHRVVGDGMRSALDDMDAARGGA